MPAPLLREGTRIGRSPECELVIDELSVSREHAAFWVDDDGQAWISDLASSNGTWHNGQLLPARRGFRLEVGDRLDFGPVVSANFDRIDDRQRRSQLALFERAIHDPMTGVHTRDYFLHRARAILERDIQDRFGPAILIARIDHHDVLVETYGAAIGGQILQRLPKWFPVSTEGEGLIARYGTASLIIGERLEGLESLRELAERARAGVEHAELELGRHRIRVTVSVGAVAASPGQLPRLPDLIKQAERSLDLAARDGGNQARCKAWQAVDPNLNTLIPVFKGFQKKGRPACG